MHLKNMLSTPVSRHCVVAALLLLVVKADAVVVSYEGFNYSAGPLNGADPGPSWNSDWVAPTGTVITSSLSYPAGSGTSSGGSVQAIGNGTSGGLNASIQFGTGFQYDMTSEGTVRYASFLGSKPTIAGGGEYLQMNFGNNSWIFGMSSGDGFFLQLGGGNENQAFSAGGLVSTNATYLLVSKLVTSSVGNDTLYLNWYASGDVVPVTEPVSWMLSVSRNNTTAGAQTTLNLGSGNAAGSYVMDEIRLGTTFADVVPEPSRAMLLLVGVMSLLARRRRS